MCVLYGAQKWQVLMILQTYISSVPQWNKSDLPLIYEIKVSLCVCVGEEKIHNYTHFLSS
jgi:hypothetical protein